MLINQPARTRAESAKGKALPIVTDPTPAEAATAALLLKEAVMLIRKWMNRTDAKAEAERRAAEVAAEVEERLHKAETERRLTVLEAASAQHAAATAGIKADVGAIRQSIDKLIVHNENFDERFNERCTAVFLTVRDRLAEEKRQQ